MANMYTVAYKHAIDKHVSWYADWALTLNHPDAHYDLGAGGRGITTDCHDAAGNCFPGGKIQGLSVGMQYNF